MFIEEDIKRYLETKADKMELVEVNNMKSNKTDTENCMRWIDILHN
jgi:hypothetical protein